MWWAALAQQEPDQTIMSFWEQWTPQDAITAISLLTTLILGLATIFFAARGRKKRLAHEVTMQDNRLAHQAQMQRERLAEERANELRQECLDKTLSALNHAAGGVVGVYGGLPEELTDQEDHEANESIYEIISESRTEVIEAVADLGWVSAFGWTQEIRDEAKTARDWTREQENLLRLLDQDLHYVRHSDPEQRTDEDSVYNRSRQLTKHNYTEVLPRISHLYGLLTQTIDPQPPQEDSSDKDQAR